MLFILEHNPSIMGSMKSIIVKNFGKFPKAFWVNFEYTIVQKLFDRKYFIDKKFKVKYFH